MTLTAVFEFLRSKHLKDLHIDSRNLQPGDVFMALPGRLTDGRNFIPQALDCDVAGIFYEPSNYTPPKACIVPLIPVENLGQHLPQIAAAYYGSPSQKLKIIGVTGTNGKTSITHYIAQFLHAQKKDCGVLGTLGNGVFPKLSQALLTTSDCCTIQRQLANFVQLHAQFVAMEVSSIGLDQGRLNQTQIDTGIFTNLSQDHLDYHHDMESYFAAKSKLFTDFQLKHAVINLDDEYGLRLLEKIAPNTNTITYSLENAKAHVYLANDVIHTPWGKGKLQIGLMGAFNKSNVLASIASCALQGIALEQLLLTAKDLQAATGRMELIRTEAQNAPLVVVDYAHTPDALIKALQALRQYQPQRLFCVFGCGGDRDRGKRPKMLQAVLANCNETIVTQDNPRTEDAQRIVEDMLAGTALGPNITIELDRAQAIHKTIKRATHKDIVLVAGKGHEDYQIIGTTKFPFSDQLVAKAALGE